MILIRILSLAAGLTIMAAWSGTAQACDNIAFPCPSDTSSHSHTLNLSDLMLRLGIDTAPFKNSIENAVTFVSGERTVHIADGNVRIVSSGEFNEVDASTDRRTMLASTDGIASDQELRNVSGMDHADKEDGLFARILMTFGGALAAAGAMKILIA